ncbi:ribose 5-phosphate isomerase B [Macrococcus equipercicus]|uniref:Ribose 5-phosphate isomerase B n=1 Tax=Macrococcus equipercicus TaxID=69967 RepID=A0A9Q9BLV5_9STAP|nr:ribose 5-phosphate isomerase B [Macrococcus equipercicus]KAA1039259.1 ribose 5-phosphate isomerase B [Macrococcus equipercicus]UTH13550.1 ribose 5-phosphate isomerase B [Macrococcus equipercicus]
MKVAIASDHGGYAYKEAIKKRLDELQVSYEDFGTHSPDSVDYPDYARPVGEAVTSGRADRGILVCGTGIGMSIAANKVKGIRCALVHDVFTAKLTRQHNDSNVIAMGQRVIGEGLALMIIETWLNESFEGGRHQKRLDKLSRLEEDYGRH